jgi:hypothetical protein
MRRLGFSPQTIADRTVTFLALTYAVYMLALVIGGFGLYLGVLAGPAPLALTLAPALLGLTAITLALALAHTPTRTRTPSPTGPSKSARCGRVSGRSASRPPPACSSWASSSGCSATFCRSPAESVESTAA